MLLVNVLMLLLNEPIVIQIVAIDLLLMLKGRFVLQCERVDHIRARVERLNRGVRKTVVVCVVRLGTVWSIRRGHLFGR